ncbi:cytochrome P450 [Apodospora peruviana]|uniref:Cytochrome P450 n=1 Tax=Apodospora peruviana TaxID=516989 RepID=A0AAE0IS14_9PEZI|nr:cytochrome P450 [Apodospora peruviana]
MVLPYRLISAISLGASYFLSLPNAPILPISGFVTTFTTLWALQFLLWALWSVVLYPKVFSPHIGLPEPEGNAFFIGQYKEIIRNPTGTPMLKWINSIPNNGLIRYLGLFNQERLLITSPEALSEVLVTKSYHFQKPGHVRYTLGRILGVGVLLAEGDEHKSQRRKLLPAFAFRHIKDLYPLFWRKAQEGVEAMTEQILTDAAKGRKKEISAETEEATTGIRPDTAVIEAGGWASRITLDIIGITGLGRDFGAIKDPNNELNQTYQHLFKPTKQARILNLLSMFFVPGWLINMLPVQRNGDIQSAANFIRATCADLIEEKKQKLARKELVDVDILSLMTFLAAGHETTASSMTWAIYLLAKHRHVQDRLRAEVRERLPSIAGGDGSSTVSSMDIDHMPFLNAVCNEVLRYFSPVPLTLRQAVCDTSIQGHFVAKGTSITLVPWAINKSESMWGPDALQFNPDRWMLKGEGDKHAASGGAKSNFAFMTFLHGPRSCIGQSFAKAEFACLLAAWIGRFSFELDNKEMADEKKLEIKGGVTARPARGLHVRATVIDGW